MKLGDKIIRPDRLQDFFWGECCNNMSYDVLKKISNETEFLILTSFLGHIVDQKRKVWN